MSTINVTGPQFESTVIQKQGISFVDFWASWCGPCRMFAPIFEEASEKYPEISFVKVDTDAEQELAAAAAITSIPTLMAFRDGVLVFRQAGALPAPEFEKLIQSVLALNMDEVKAEIEKEKNKVN
jgi:thioredoxin 1